MRLLGTLLLLLIMANLAACASAPYRSVPLDSLDILLDLGLRLVWRWG